jgi:predicted GNAT family N-acyltransferase
MGSRVVEISAADTHQLRRRVLRRDLADAVVVFDGDELDATFHLGVTDDDGTLIAVATWLPRAYPDRPGEAGFQLRGMATAPEHQRAGAGTTLLASGIERCRQRGAALVWARARDTALDFYSRHGFEVVGLGYVDLATGLPHHDVIRDL